MKLEAKQFLSYSSLTVMNLAKENKGLLYMHYCLEGSKYKVKKFIHKDLMQVYYMFYL